ncbi:MAG TPA: tagaturonate epimerase family protein [Armatimonadota bacterium]|nr:tagaturonate epimerase family protein [Armatimonadota bacterium]
MRLALKFADSLRVSKQLYDYARRALGHDRFSVEIALDETAEPTRPRDTLFWLTEAKAMGLPVHYVGPHLGFAKRVDYTGDLGLLQRRTRQQHAISQGVCGALLSIHSGDGSSPSSGKGRGVYEALVAGTGGELKFKISDVYFELLMDMLAGQPARSEGRRLFERIFDAVEGLLRGEVSSGGLLVTPLLRRQLAQQDRAVKRDPKRRRDSRAQFFRFNQYLALNIRDERGRRYLRQALVEYVTRDGGLRAEFDREAKELTLRLIDGLGLADNI